MRNNYRKKINDIISLLNSRDLIKDIGFVPSFNDDPKVFLYCTHLKNISKYTDGINFTPEGSGFSLTSSEAALFKSLTEVMERFCLSSYRHKNGIYTSFNTLKKEKHLSLDPYQFLSNIKVRDWDLLWMKGRDFISGEPNYIPAQLIYYTYRHLEENYLMAEINSNGGAGGFTQEFAVSRAIYEAVERDAFFTIYLNKISPPRIRISKMKLKQALELEKDCLRYNLEMLLFDITNDLSIPTFMAILVDKTGLGPAITVGLKSNLNPTDAIIGSLEEVFNTRTSFRTRMISNRKKIQSNFIYSDINTFEIRNLFWASPQKLHYLDFLLKAPYHENHYHTIQLSEKEQLQLLKDIFRKKKMSVFDMDVSHDIFKQIGYLVHKIVIPDLQPLYTMEKAKYLKNDRLKAVASFFGKKTLEYNPIPHFFL